MPSETILLCRWQHTEDQENAGIALPGVEEQQPNLAAALLGTKTGDGNAAEGKEGQSEGLALPAAAGPGARKGSCYQGRKILERVCSSTIA